MLPDKALPSLHRCQCKACVVVVLERAFPNHAGKLAKCNRKFVRTFLRLQSHGELLKIKDFRQSNLLGYQCEHRFESSYF